MLEENIKLVACNSSKSILDSKSRAKISFDHLKLQTDDFLLFEKPIPNFKLRFTCTFQYYNKRDRKTKLS